MPDPEDKKEARCHQCRTVSLKSEIRNAVADNRVKLIDNYEHHSY